jgi:hypothetical protein
MIFFSGLVPRLQRAEREKERERGETGHNRQYASPQSYFLVWLGCFPTVSHTAAISTSALGCKRSQIRLSPLGVPHTLLCKLGLAFFAL